MTLADTPRDDVSDVEARAIESPRPPGTRPSASAQSTPLEPTSRGDGPPPAGAVRPSARFMRSHPAHWVALGFGAGLSPVAPGTVGTLWAWLAWVVLGLWLNPAQLGGLLALALPISWWASTVTAQHLRLADPSAIVADEIVAFWIILWLLLPASLWAQFVAFALFRFFDAVKPGPVGWADRLLHGARGWKGGFGILLDDLVAAFCALLIIALWHAGN